MSSEEVAVEHVSCASEGISQVDISMAGNGVKNGAYVLVETVVGKSLEVSQALRTWDWVASVERMVVFFLGNALSAA